MRKIIFVNLFGLLITINSIAQVDSKIALIDSMTNLYSDYYGFCGTLLIERNGQILLNKGYGYASYELNVPCTDSTMYHICSITKGFSRTLIDKLVKEGKIDLNDKLITYLPEIGEEMGNKILVKHVVMHQSGIPERFFFPDRNTRLDNIKSISKLDLNFEPGTKREYCNLNYEILGVIIERISGYDLASAFKEEIFKPLGMFNSKLNLVENMTKNMAIPHYVNQVNQAEMFIHVNPKPNDMGFAAGGIIMTTRDLLKWVNAFHLDFFELSQKEEMPEYYNNIYGNFSMGWETNGVKRRYAEGDGIGEGSRSLYLYFPDDSLTILYLNNSYYFPSEYNSSRNIVEFDKIVYNSANIMLERGYELPKRPIGEVLIKQLKTGLSIEKVIAEYLTKSKESDYLFDIKQLNRVAYYLMDNNRNEDALEILNLNLSEYPEHWIANDGMAEYYLRIGDKENAIKYLKISLDKNPNKWREQRKMNDIRRNNLETLTMRTE
jgi:CubicO group peptidase (beta-lactamase class C family)